MGEKHVWAKRGSRFQLPRIPRPSRALLVIPGVMVVSLSLVGLLAVPAGSPPLPPAVAAAPIATDQPTETPAVQPVSQPTSSEQPATDPPRQHCHPHVHPISKTPTPGIVLYSDLHFGAVSLYDPRTDTQMRVLDSTGLCDFMNPTFINGHTIEYTIMADYPAEAGNFVLDLPTGAVRHLKGNKLHWEWLAVTSLSPDGNTLAELGGRSGDAFSLVVTSTRTGRIIYTKRIGWICGCDGDWTPQDLRWSSDGAFLLTAVPTQASHEIFLFDASGRNVRSPMAGAFPRWIADTHTFIFQDAKGSWQRADGLAAPPHTFFRTTSSLADPAFSPDAQKVAFWDTNKFDVVVFDIASGRSKVFGRTMAYPLWLSDETIAALGATNQCNCEGFDFTGKTWSFSITSGRLHPIRMNSTQNADVLR